MFLVKWFESPPPPQTLFITDMPDLVMAKILETADFLSILRLRKTCHSFRNFIDELKPDYGLRHVRLNWSSDCIGVILGFTNYPMRNLVLDYEKNENGGGFTLRILGDCMKQNKFREDEDFLDAFFKDLGVILRNQKAPLEVLNIVNTSDSIFYREKPVIKNAEPNPIARIFNCWKSKEDEKCPKEPEKVVDKFFDWLQNILTSRAQKIQTRNMKIEVKSPSCFIKMAPFINMKKLERLGIKKMENEEKTENFNEIAELEDWESIPELKIEGFQVTLPLQTFLHKSTLKLSVPTLTMEDVLLIKQTFIASPLLDYHKVHYNTLKDMDQLHSALGEGDGNNVKTWYHDIPETRQEITIVHDANNRFFCFSQYVECDSYTDTESE
ncbi:hypothetical protein GCK72_011251 [Caenorhabditis remanei]|uniref:F-box domain-containing protein n=1 Tax=Caenorhabditis remanei TaxID=31234 RepID=A0A6A5H7Y7_CAERE|nr:hypothetical protein GCK72_011251 [Caenorhabditis remanei]KAF1762986.1 hypothetical protein GCK72_011251 [Caenorhabditis remanei]